MYFCPLRVKIVHLPEKIPEVHLLENSSRFRDKRSFPSTLYFCEKKDVQKLFTQKIHLILK